MIPFCQISSNCTKNGQIIFHLISDGIAYLEFIFGSIPKSSLLIVIRLLRPKTKVQKEKQQVTLQYLLKQLSSRALLQKKYRKNYEKSSIIDNINFNTKQRMIDCADFGCFPGMDDDNCSFDINNSVPENQNFPNPNYSNLIEDPNEDNFQPVQEHSTENTRPSEQGTSGNASPKAKQPRKDNHSKNLPQNISSTIQTQVPKILYGGPLFKKSDIKQCKKRLNDFLKENKANSNQLVVLFAYLFMLQENASESQFKELQKELTKYLNKRIDESGEFDHEDRAIFVEKIEVNKKLVERYFNGCNEAIDLEEVKMICRKLFTGRQENTIEKPLKTLAELQKRMLKEESQFLFKSSQPQLVQSFFESFEE